MIPDFAKGGRVRLSMLDHHGKFQSVIGGDAGPEMVIPLRSKRSETLELKGSGRCDPDLVAIIEQAARVAVRKMIERYLAQFIILNVIRLRAGLPLLPIECFGVCKTRPSVSAL